MPYEQGRVHATIAVAGKDYTHILTSSTPPAPEFDVGESQAGQGASYPVLERINALTYTYDVEGDFAELNEMAKEQTISYEEETATPGEEATKTIGYEIEGRQTSVVRSPFVNSQNGLPTITHNFRVLKYRETHNGTVEWDIDLTVHPQKIQYKGASVIKGLA